MMSHPVDRWLLVLALAAVLALAGALVLQFVGGYAPCHLCILERYPYLVVLAACGLGWWTGRVKLALAVAAAAMAVDAGLAGFHVGVEQGWFALPESCLSLGQAATIEELKAQLLAAPARCDQVPLTVLGLSLAAWNGVYAAALMVVALVGLGRRLSS